MSRNTRAALAITAALALLAGSGASFARWYDEKALSDANVTTGVLSIEQTPGSESWLINTPDSDDTADATVPFDPANDKIVPGDVVTYSTTFTLHLEGKNLRASAALLPEGLDTSVDGLSVSSEFDCGSANLAPRRPRSSTSRARRTTRLRPSLSFVAIPRRNLIRKAGRRLLQSRVLLLRSPVSRLFSSRTCVPLRFLSGADRR